MSRISRDCWSCFSVGSAYRAYGAEVQGHLDGSQQPAREFLSEQDA